MPATQRSREAGPRREFFLYTSTLPEIRAGPFLLTLTLFLTIDWACPRLIIVPCTRNGTCPPEAPSRIRSPCDTFATQKGWVDPAKRALMCAPGRGRAFRSKSSPPSATPASRRCGLSTSIAHAGFIRPGRYLSLNQLIPGRVFIV